MATQSLDNFVTMLGQVAAGSLAGKQQAQQENDQEQQQRQQQFLQAMPMLAHMQEQQRNAQMAPYEALDPFANQMDPESRARFLTARIHAAGQPQAALPWAAGAKVFDEDNPLHGVFQGMAGGQPGGAPPVVAPLPASGQIPGQLPRGTPYPGIERGLAPPAAGAAPSAGPRVAAAVNPRAITTPFGNFNLAGVSDAQRKAQQADFERADSALRRGGLQGEALTQYQGLTAGYNPNPQTPEEYQHNQQVINQIHGLGVATLSPQVVGANMRAETKTYGDRLGKLRQGKYSDLGAASELAAIHRLGQGIGQRYGNQTDVPVNDLAAYDAEIGRIDALLSPDTPEGVPKEKEQLAADRREAGGLARDIMADQKNPGSAADEAKEFTAAQRLLANLSPEQARDPQKAAAAIQDVAPKLAQRIRENGLQFGGDRAERRYAQVLGQFKQFSGQGVAPAAKAAYADELVAAARLAGRKIELTGDDIMNTDPLLAAKLKKAGLEIQLDQGKLGMQPLEVKTREARLGLIAAQTHETNLRSNALIVKGKTGAAQKGLLTQNAQLRLDTDAEKTASKTYWETVKTNALNLDPKFDVTKVDPKTERDPGKRAARKAYDVYVQARQRTQGTLRSMKVNVADPQWDPIAGNAAPARAAASPAGAAPAARPAAKAAPVPLQQQRETYYQGLLHSGASPHEANVLMQHRFGASP